MSTAAPPEGSRLDRALPGLNVLRTYQRAWLRGDLIAGIALTALLIPAGMGYAELAGLPPVTGLYASIVPLIVYAIVGPSRILVLGPDSAIAPIIAAAIVPLAVADEERVALAGLLALEVGAVLVIAGALRLGFVTDLLSKPIRIGFLNGIALVVIVSQLPKLLGFAVDSGRVRESAVDIVTGIADGKVATYPAVLGIICLAVILILKRWRKAIPGVLVAVVGSMIVTAVFGWYDGELDVVGAIPQGLPSMALGGITVRDAIDLFPAALGIALIAFADTSVLSRTFAARAGHTVNGSQEMAAVGAANVATGLLSGFPVSGSSSRTPVVEQSGARTQLAPLLGAILIIVFIVAAPGVTRYLPSAALAAVVIAAALSLIEVRSVRTLFRAKPIEGALTIAATLGVVLIGVLPGIAIAVVLSLIAFVNLARRPYRTELGRVPGLRGYHDLTRDPDTQRIDDTLILRFDAPLFFANGTLFYEFIHDRVVESQRAGRTVHTVVLAAEPITEIDATAVDDLVKVDDFLRRNQIRLVLAEMKSPVREQLDRYGLQVDGQPRFRSDNFAPTVGTIVDEITGTLRTDIDNDG